MDEVGQHACLLKGGVVDVFRDLKLHLVNLAIEGVANGDEDDVLQRDAGVEEFTDGGEGVVLPLRDVTAVVEFADRFEGLELPVGRRDRILEP